MTGDILDVVEEDDGSGWTRVARAGNKGLVPTTYLRFVSDQDERPEQSVSPSGSAADSLASSNVKGFRKTVRVRFEFLNFN